MSYQDELTRHLTQFKKEHLGGLPAGIYRYRGRDVPRDHILPPQDRWLNLLEETRDEIKSFLRSNPQIKTHRYFHHLNSSQAFALNLFVPFFQGGSDASTALLHAFGQRATLANWEPEAIPDAEEGTNLDAVWDTTDGVRTFCEVKLSERDFGKARLDKRHLDKLRDIYIPRLAPYLAPEMRLAPAFFESYQVMRNVWHLTGVPKGQLIFLMPRANKHLWAILDASLSRVSPLVRDRIARVAIEDVLDRLSANKKCPPRLRAYADKLRQKYVPSDRVTL